MFLRYEAVCPNVSNDSCRIQSSLLSTTRWWEREEEDGSQQRRGLNRWQSFPLVLNPLLRHHRHPPDPLSLLGHDLRVLGYVLLALLLQAKIEWNVYNNNDKKRQDLMWFKLWSICWVSKIYLIHQKLIITSLQKKLPFQRRILMI